MKKSFKTVISFMVITLLVLSFSSCTIFENMRQNALEASQTTIYATPEDAKIIAEYNEILDASVQKAVSIKENISYSAGTPNVLKDGEEAGILDAASKQLKNFIMSANPGSAEYWVKGAPEGEDTEYETKELSASLIKNTDETAVLGFDFSRNIATENVTDDKGNNITEEDGNPVVVEKISDNILHLTLNYFDVTALDGTEYETTADGQVEEETTVVYAENATIESIFGTNKDKEAVLKNFESIKDYITVSDYDIAYKNCYVTTDADLENETVSFINFQKNMTVTAKAEGVGALASYGEIEVTFDLTMTTYYEFTYAAEEDETADDAEETSAEKTSDTETSAVADASEESASDETASVISEETSAEESTAA